MTKKKVWREYFDAILIALVLALIIRAFVMQAYQIPSGSMLNTLLVGDRLLVSKLSYDVKIPFTNISIVETGSPEFGDVIVFEYPVDPEQDFIKRVVGLPGDTIEMRNKIFFRNGQIVNEPYVRHCDPGISYQRDNFGPLTIPEGKYFVMGDNRDNSADSRAWKYVDRGQIRGKAWRMYWSWGRGGAEDSGDTGESIDGPRWGRIGMLIE